MTHFNIFPQSSAQDWRMSAELALKGKPFEKTLHTQSLNGFDILPLYERAKNAPLIAREASVKWGVVQRVDYAPHMNAQALEDLEGGATGLVAVMKGSQGDFTGHGLTSLEGLFEGVYRDLISLRIDGDHIPKEEFLSLSLGLSHHSKHLKEALDSAAHHVILCDGRVVHHKGANEAQELAYVLSEGIAALKALQKSGLPLDDARRKISFLLTATNDEFVTLAKFRALRLLWAKVEEACGLKPHPLVLHGETSFMMMTKHDASVNWLRATSAVMGAGLGGADYLTVLPHSITHGVPESDARRMARNIQHVLLEESNLHRVSDPASGAGGLEALTDNLCLQAWDLFQTGVTNEAIEKISQARLKHIATRKIPLTGTSEFPALQEAPIELLTGYAQDTHIKRYAEPIENTRKKGGSIFLITIGNLSDFTPRLSFAQNFFTVGGVSYEVGEVSDFKTGIVCLCASDSLYNEQGQEIIDKLLAKGAKAVFVAGKTELKGIHASIHAGCNVVEVLQEFQKL